MKNLFILVLIPLALSCSPKKNYDDSELDKINKKNLIIKPFGTYKSEGLIGPFNIPMLYIDSSSLQLVYLDSNQKETSIVGSWQTQSLDTQFFSYSAPFKQAIFTAGGVIFLDSFRRYFFTKTSDSIISIPIQDSLNIVK
ncbi:hypothetical protein OAB01_01060 [Bacteroidia bacterium]|nr:hypothetical protein [Bacteroidia bacterium]